MPLVQNKITNGNENGELVDHLKENHTLNGANYNNIICASTQFCSDSIKMRLSILLFMVPKALSLKKFKGWSQDNNERKTVFLKKLIQKLLMNAGLVRYGKWMKSLGYVCLKDLRWALQREKWCFPFHLQIPNQIINSNTALRCVWLGTIEGLNWETTRHVICSLKVGTSEHRGSWTYQAASTIRASKGWRKVWKTQQNTLRGFKIHMGKWHYTLTQTSKWTQIQGNSLEAM